MGPLLRYFPTQDLLKTIHKCQANSVTDTKKVDELRTFSFFDVGLRQMYSEHVLLIIEVVFLTLCHNNSNHIYYIISI